METIEFRDVNFAYPLSETKALDDVSFKIEQSEFVVLCGKSGCGKSTLLKHMKKNLMPYGNLDGTVMYMGQEISNLDDRVNAAEIGFVQQNPDNQIVTDKVWHELAFGLESLGFSNAQIKRRVAEMASYFNIQAWFRKDVSQLSGGQKQLLNLASIMAMQPKVLVLDEPTSQLDPIAASDFLQTLYRINRDLGTTVILSEHRLEEAFTMADKVMVMDRGRIIAFDTPRKIGHFLEGDDSGAKHPMFYGLPAVMKIYQWVEGGVNSPLNIREGRLWIDDLMARSKGLDGETADTEFLSKATTTSKSVASNPAIDLDNLWFRYDKKSDDVLRGLTVSIDRGQLFCVLGGNGVGKSTTLKAICQMVNPQRGKINIDGKLAMLPQNPQALFTEITVEEELFEAFMGDNSIGDAEKLDQVENMLDLMEIKHLRKSHPYDLSGGEQQRLALGKVLLLKPEIILLDEPTKGLDPFFKITLGGILKKLIEEGCTIFMVSHDIEFCAEYGDRCAMFFDGDIVSVGEPREFFSGNNFYTTSANKMAREYLPDGINWEEVAQWLREKL